MDPASVTIGAAMITASVSILASTVNLAYRASKDIWCVIRKKKPYRKNLNNNYDKLERELEKLIALATDIDMGLTANSNRIKNSSCYKEWEKRVWSLKKEVNQLLKKYESTKFHKAKLSKKFENKCAEVTLHLNEGFTIISLY